jgi:hypothetical protein
MTYEQFEKKYLELFHLMFKYGINECGLGYYAGELGKLVDEYPSYSEIIDEKIDKREVC